MCHGKIHMLELAVLVPASLLEVAHLGLLLHGLVLHMMLLLYMLLLLDRLLLDGLLPVQICSPLLHSNTRVEEMTTSPRQEATFLASSAPICPITLLLVLATSDSFEPIEALSNVHLTLVVLKLLQCLAHKVAHSAAVVGEVRLVSLISPLGVAYRRICWVLTVHVLL